MIDTATGRLRAMVALAEDTDAERSAAAWIRYLGRLTADADALDTAPETAALLMRLREAGPGWPTRSDRLGRAISEARRRGPRLVGPEDRGGPEDPETMRALDLTATGGPRKSLRNVATVLRLDPRWTGRIRHNEFTGAVEVDGEQLQDVTMSGAAIWIDAHYGIDVPSSKVGEAVQLVARDDPYHPIRDYLDGLVWDGLPRLGELLEGYLGAARDDDGHGALLSALGERFAVGCVARVYEPGCKLDTVLVLCGAQGAGKSTAIEALASPVWFSDTDIDPQHKDSYQQVQGVWVMELQEIDGWNNRRDQATIKKFVSSRSDRYRPPYGRCMVDQPRQCVFVGSTNEDRFLADRTGSRRYWPVLVGQIEIADLRHDRDQIWAEAVRLYRSGTPWHLTREEGDELRGASERHQQIDPWAESVDEWMVQRRAEGHDGSTLADVMSGIGLDTKSRSTGAGGRVASILKALGYESHRIRRDGRRRVEWYRSS